MTQLSVDIRIINEKETRRLLRKFPKKADRTLAVGIRQALRILKRESQKDRNLRFKNPTGATKASFKTRSFKITGNIRPTTYYAPYVYFGTSRLRPKAWTVGGRRVIAFNPFMDRILHAGRKEVNRAINRQVARFITGEVGKYINR